MIRRIIEIDESKCNGCGKCAKACHEGAIGMIDGKAKLIRDDYCDGLGDCLPTCPTDAISFIEREAAPYDEEAVKKAQEEKKKSEDVLPCGCPGSSVKTIKREEKEDVLPCGCPGSSVKSIEKKENTCSCNSESPKVESELSQWPVQIKLVPVNAKFLDGADLLIAADCAAYAYGNFHSEFIKGRVTLIGCPKLDSVDYSEKLEAMFRENNIKSVTIARMQIPCCTALEKSIKKALQSCGKSIPCNTFAISPEGKVTNLI
ncbi:ATP-binding protein [Intestinibacter sp.]